MARKGAFSHNAEPVVNRAPNSTSRLRRLGAPPSIRWGTTLILAASTAVGIGGGAWLRDATLAAESRFLALLAAFVLVPTFSLRQGSRLGIEAGLVPILALLGGWTLPPPERGAAVVGLLVVALFAAALRVQSWTLERLVAAAMAIQVLYRSDLLLAPAASALAHWVALPIVAATGVALLERSNDRRALTAGAVILAVAGGTTPAAAVGLLVLGAACRASGRSRAVRGAVLGGAILLTSLGGVASRWQWWSPAESVLLVAAVVVLFGIEPHRARRATPPTTPIDPLEWRRWWGAVILLAAAVLPLLATPRPWSSVGRELAWLFVLLPFLGGTLASVWRSDAGDRVALVSALALAVPALRALAPPQALPCVLVLAVFALPAHLLSPSALWGGGLLAGSLLLGSYPWLRDLPLEHLITALRLPPLGWQLALIVTVAAILWTWLPRRRLLLGWILAGLLVLRLALGGSWEVLNAWPPIELSADRRGWTLDGLEGATSELIIDTALANSAGLEPGTKVAELRLVSAEPGSDVRWPLHSATETGEWAAGREDLLALEAPRPWLVTVDPTGHFFARRYRAHLELAQPLAAHRLVIRRAPRLPPDVVLSVFYVARQTSGDRHRSPPQATHPEAAIDPAAEELP